MTNQTERTAELLLNHCNTYPKLQEQDVFKYIFQSVFGCEHLLTDESTALEHIKREYEKSSKKKSPITEALDGQYCRIFLSCIDEGLKPETLSRLFCLSAKREENGKELLIKKLEVAKELVRDDKLPFDSKSFNKSLDEWRAQDYPPIHHSDEFREDYHPSYRVVAKRYADFLPLFTAIDRLSEKETLTLAIEGGSASGKSTLASILKEVYDCNVFHTDDFFLRPEQRTPERFAEVGGNLDRERFEEEVVRSLRKNETVRYRPFDCGKQSIGDVISVTPKKLTVIEGVYSMHCAFGKYYDLAVFLDIDPEYQKKRILKRNTQVLAERFFNEWIPLENKYFAQMKVKNHCDEVIKISE